MKLRDVTGVRTETIRRFARNEVVILWADDWYDGPIRGMAQVSGVRCLFDIIDRNALGDADEDRTYWLIQLTNEQLKEEEHWHELFCNSVGTHFDFTGREPSAKENTNPSAFYGRFRNLKPADYRDNEVIGWFRL